MELIRISRVMGETARGHLSRGRTIGFVPTMGALHDGHLSLVRMARQENDIVVVSIYVNPKQFSPTEDLSRYPRTLEEDIDKLGDADILFLPDDGAMYPDRFATFVEVTGLSGKLCGAFRPGHFRGVATIVTKLFNIVRPTRAYFGQKDFQQTVVIKRIVRDLDMDIEVVVCPTVREEDGLARSSRNRYLSASERPAATVLFRGLLAASEAVRSGIINTERIRILMLDIFRAEPLVKEVEYCSVIDPETLEDLEEVKGKAVLAVALRIGTTRLIDNMLVSRP